MMLMAATTLGLIRMISTLIPRRVHVHVLVPTPIAATTATRSPCSIMCVYLFILKFDDFELDAKESSIIVY